MRLTLSTLSLCAALAAAPAAAQEVKVGANDSFETLVSAQKGKRVTLRTRSGGELTGVVRAVTPRYVHLGALAGRDFFDAVVALETLEAVIVRTKE
jgi:hypothetical protein